LILRGAIYTVEFPSPVGGGEDDPASSEPAYDRPAVIVQAEEVRGNPYTITVVPGTSNTEAGRIDFTVLAKPTPGNGLRETTVFLPFHVQSIDVSRLREERGRLEPEHMESLGASLRHLLGI
jgi:mRNA-degrading endonuclease toxin of MazEF toxin-antitoxin module